MLSPNHLSDFLNKNLRLVAYCPLCENRYSPLEAKVLDEKEGAHLIYVRCRKCHSSIVALVLTTPGGITSLGLVTDLTSEDVLKFKDSSYVTIDDVIEIHHLLERQGVEGLNIEH